MANQLSTDAAYLPSPPVSDNATSKPLYSSLNHTLVVNKRSKGISGSPSVIISSSFNCHLQVSPLVTPSLASATSTVMIIDSFTRRTLFVSLSLVDRVKYQ